MANKAFIEDARKFLKGSYVPPNKIWKCLNYEQDAQNIAFYMQCLLQAITTNTTYQCYQAMLSTIFVLQFYKNTKKKPQHRSLSQRFLQHSYWVIEMYTKDAQGYHFTHNFISHLCHLRKPLSWKMDPGLQFQEYLDEKQVLGIRLQKRKAERHYSCLRQICYPYSFSQSRIIAFSYNCYLDLMRSSQLQIKKNIYVHMEDTLRALLYSLQSTTRTRCLLVSFMHFVETSITNYGCPFDDVLRDMLYLVHLAKAMPGEVGHIAQGLFTVLQSQLKFKGSNFRRKIKRYFPSLDCKKSVHLESQRYLVTKKVDIFSCPEMCEVATVRKLLIYNVLKCAEIEQADVLWTNVIINLDVDTAYTMYYKLMRIVEIAMGLEVYESIQHMLKESILQLFKLNWMALKNASATHILQIQEMVFHKNQYRFFQFPSFSIQRVTSTTLATQSQANSLFMLLSKSDAPPYSSIFYQSKLNIVHLGDDRQLSELINAIASTLIQLRPKDMKKVRFYLLPVRTGQCSLCEFIGAKDLWYKRFIYDIYAQESVYPYLQLQQQNRGLFPLSFYPKTMQMYLREAQRKVPIRVFLCSLSLSSGVEQSVYFVSHVLVGASVEVETTRQKTKRSEKVFDIMEYYLEQTKPNPTSMRIKSSKKSAEVVAVEDMHILHTPRDYFFGGKPSPVSQMLEVSILSGGNVKAFRSEMQCKEHFKKHSEQEIYQAMKELFFHQSMDNIQVEIYQKKNSIKIVIDGEIYQGVNKFKIELAYTKSQLPLVLPVQCFLPFQL